MGAGYGEEGLTKVYKKETSNPYKNNKRSRELMWIWWWYEDAMHLTVSRNNTGLILFTDEIDENYNEDGNDY